MGFVASGYLGGTLFELNGHEIGTLRIDLGTGGWPNGRVPEFAAPAAHKSCGTSMSKSSTAMEQQVERIKRLLEPLGTAVTWNEKIVDPDNTKQLRQIDVTIRKDGKLTHVECRLHADPQDVGWIEELMGRRISLRADAMIAVSSSGFTEGAILKADAQGIVLRNLATISAEEVQQWGRATDARLVYYEFDDTVVTFTVPKDRCEGSHKIAKSDTAPFPLRGLLELVMREAEDYPELDHGWGEFALNFGADVSGGGAPAAGIIETKIHRVVRTASLVSVVAYSAARSPVPETYARVQHYDPAFEVIDAENEVAVVFDLSGVPAPKNCLLHGATLDFGRVVTLRWMKPIGIIEAIDLNAVVEIRVRVATH